MNRFPIRHSQVHGVARISGIRTRVWNMDLRRARVAERGTNLPDALCPIEIPIGLAVDGAGRGYLRCGTEMNAALHGWVLAVAIGAVLAGGGCKREAEGEGKAPGGGAGGAQAGQKSGGPGGSASPAAGPVMQVVTAIAARQPVHETLALVGTFMANEQIEVKSESEGFVEKIGFSEGQEVTAGALLVTLDETKLKAALEEAEASLQLSRQTHERTKGLLDAKLVSNQEFDRTASMLASDEATVALRRRQMRDARVVAPFEGVVGARQVSPGQLVTRATTLTWLVDLDPVKVEFNVPERFLRQVQVGQPIDVAVAAWPEKRFLGKVFFVAPFVAPDTRTVLVKAEVPNPERLLKPGMFANLDLTLEIRGSAVVIPEAALSQTLDGNRAVVMVVGEGDMVSAKPIKVGMRLKGAVEVVEGLAGSERVVVQGLQKIAPGMKVRVAADSGGPTSVPAAAAAPGGSKRPG